jgi:hypothetical protein
MMDEGYIKFKCNLIKDKPLPMAALSEINQWRNKLYQVGLIGAYADGIGYGNISIRSDNNLSFPVPAQGLSPNLTKPVTPQ